MFAVSLTPGPAAAFCIAVGLEEHDRSAVWAPVGVSLGKLTHLALAAVGASWINELPSTFRLTVLGTAVIYLMWQGYRHWTQRTALIHHHDSRRGPRAFHIVADGFAVAAANPESLASSVAILPLFVRSETSSGGLAALVAVGTVAVFLAYSLYESIAVTLAHRLTSRSQNRLVGATYLAAAAGLFAIAVI